MSKDNIKEPLIIKEHGFFTSMKSLEDVMDYMTKYGGKENAYLCAMTQAFTINTIVRMMDEECDGTATCKRSANPILNLREAKS